MKPVAQAKPMKKVYFACAVAGGRDHAFVYQDIVDIIKELDVEVFGEALADPNLEAEVGTNPKYTPRYVWKRNTGWLEQVDGLIAEVTQPSLGVGHIMAVAEGMKIPILALFYKRSDRRFSPMIKGNPHIRSFEYSNRAELEKTIRKFISQASQPNSA
jgi:2'-deoxynucleoside 5'-phosphate N-hydrolase